MNYLSMCAIVKDEDQYIPEWVMYHRLVGATHFYLYDNESRVPVSELIKPFDHGDITVVRFPGKAMQTKAYMDAVDRAKGASFWLAVMDPDEFLIPVKDKDVIDVLKPFEVNAALCVNWQMFGSSGHMSKPPGFQIEAYLKRNVEGSEVNTHVKSIVRPEFVVRAQNPHSFVYTKGMSAVNENGTPVPGAFSSPVSVQKIKINHYFARTEPEYRVKVSKGDAGGAGSKDMTLFNAANREATVHDSSACRFGPHLRAAYYNDRIKVP